MIDTNGIPRDGQWRVIQKRPRRLAPGRWRTWLVARSNIFPGANPTFPMTAEDDARAIFGTVTQQWPDTEWAIIDPDHNVVERHPA